MSKKQRSDVYQEVTNLIIDALESGVKPWAKPWDGSFAGSRITMPLRQNGEAYRGINVLILWAVSQKKGYQSAHWMTYKQAKVLGGQIRKGEKSAPVFFAGKLILEDEEKADEKEKVIRFMKPYRVFNVEQIDDLPEEYYLKPKELPELEKMESLPLAEKFISNIEADIRYGGNRAYYSPSDDYIQMPPQEVFETNHTHYATLCHELTHWTRHKSRLNRDLGRKSWGDEGYAMEELVAELGSAFISVNLDIIPDIEGNHASYIDNWLKVLKSDKKAIFQASALAQTAVNYLHDLQN